MSMTTGAVVGAIRVGDPDAITGKVVCGKARRRPMPARQARPPAPSGPPGGQGPPRSPRRPRGPARPAHDGDRELADAVLRLVRRGRTAIINLTESQRVALSDPEGLLALSLLGHLLAARYAAGVVGEFPLTEKFVRRLSTRIGIEVGRNAAR